MTSCCRERGLFYWDVESWVQREALGPVGGQAACVGAQPAAPSPQPWAGPAPGHGPFLKEVGTGADESALLQPWEKEGVLSTPTA